MKKRKQISSEEAQRIGESLHLDWDHIDLEQFRQGLMGEVDQANMDPETGRTYDSVLLSGKLVVAHMQEFPGLLHPAGKAESRSRQAPGSKKVKRERHGQTTRHGQP